MLRHAMPHASFNPDGAVSFPEEVRPMDVEPAVSTYDWMIEMLGQSLSEPWVKEKLGERGWKVKAFDNFKAYLVRTYGTTEPRLLYQAWFSDDGKGQIPVWDRTSDTATEPIGWFDSRSNNYRRGDQEELIHEDKPEDVSLVMAWIRRICRFGS